MGFMGGVVCLALYQHTTTHSLSRFAFFLHANAIRSHGIIKIRKSKTADYTTETRIKAKTSAWKETPVHRAQHHSISASSPSPAVAAAADSPIP